MKTTRNRKESINNKGFTLVELLVALSILLIVSIAFLTLFTNSYSDIIKSGTRNKKMYEIQERIEESIASKDLDNGDELTISFPGSSHPIKVSGSFIKEEVEVKGKELSISVFIPK